MPFASLAEEVTWILVDADGPLSSREIYERSDLAADPSAVATEICRLRRSGKIETRKGASAKDPDVHTLAGAPAPVAESPPEVVVRTGGVRRQKQPRQKPARPEFRFGARGNGATQVGATNADDVAPSGTLDAPDIAAKIDTANARSMGHGGAAIVAGTKAAGARFWFCLDGRLRIETGDGSMELTRDEAELLRRFLIAQDDLLDRLEAASAEAGG